MAKTSTQLQTIPETGYIRLATLIDFIPFSKSTVWRKVNAGKFPKPYKLSENITAWKAEDIRNWMDKIGQGEVS